MSKHLLIAAVLILISALSATAQTASAQDKDQITEVTLERTGCFGTCPIYRVTLRRDGTLIYEGIRFVSMLGTYKGQAYDFARLAEFILAQDYFNLKDDYWIQGTDLPSTITSVVRADKRKTVTNNAGIGPVGLWGIEMVIDGIWRSAKLEKVVEPPARPRSK